MSELYRSSDDSGTEASQPAAETGFGARADHEPARDNAARQRQDNAAIEARLDGAGLPTRAESRAAARGPDAADEDDSGEGDPAARYGGEQDALTAEGHAPNYDSGSSDGDRDGRSSGRPDTGYGAFSSGGWGGPWRPDSSVYYSDVPLDPYNDPDDTEKIDQQIESAVDAANPRYDRAESAYSENCTGVVQAYELRRCGHHVQAGPLEKHLRTDEGGPGGRRLDVIEEAWGGRFIPGSRQEGHVGYL